MTINQTGQAIENILIIMAAYLFGQPFDLGVHELVQNKRIALTSAEHDRRHACRDRKPSPPPVEDTA